MMHRRPTEGLSAATEGQMLVINRKPGQRVRIGDCWLTVLGTKGRQIRLGFEGPPETQIDREELLDTPDTQQEGDAEG